MPMQAGKFPALKNDAPVSRPLVLVLDDLARRRADVDTQVFAAVFGGTVWFARVWKRLALRVRRQRWVLSRLLIAMVRIAARAVVLPLVARPSIFRAASLAFRF